MKVQSNMTLLASRSPQPFVARNLNALQSQWSGVRDGDIESVHQARVATRRIRAALPLLVQATQADRRLFKDVGRRLGRVRELDVAEGLLAKLERQVPSSACGIAALRRDVRAHQDRARVKMLKSLDRIDLRAEIKHIRHASLGRHLAAYWRDVPSEIRRQVVAASDAVTEAIVNAAGMYMPKRLHSVRIAAKKLRYSIEIADDTGVMAGTHIVPRLRKAQETLGRLHDVQVLLGHAQKFRSTKGAEQVGDDLRILEAVLAAECQALHGKYLVKRERLLLLCDICRRAAKPRRVAHAAKMTVRSLAALSLAAAPIVVWRETEGRVAEPEHTRKAG
jgi:CHAD domain-containing protein